MNPSSSVTKGALEWGRHYVMVEPTHFRVDYAINPFMDPAVQPDPARASDQWRGLVATLREVGARVDVIEQRPDAPDMVYAMNLGLGLVGPTGPARGAVPHALPAAADGDPDRGRAGSASTAFPRRTSAATASAPTSRPATRSRSAATWSSATARAPRSSR